MDKNRSGRIIRGAERRTITSFSISILPTRNARSSLFLNQDLTKENLYSVTIFFVSRYHGLSVASSRAH
ncbi:hypothetical protein VN97_g6401 [Penicillium thymicola]|uniref:Uncharacterized protein n=1 Tax=Penicillium thymicola TaxID=293382 RepID=A0AAI9TGZ5_PENTH|nr:hypothetical protein VN97_g6401 [Penicillium thymicola]